MSRRQAAAIVLGISLALLGGSIARAVRIAQDTSRYGHAYAYGPLMMGLGYRTAKAAPVAGIAQARQRAQAFADRLGLKTSEILRFQLNYDVKLVDRQGRNATEVLVDPGTGAVSFEYGPAMMWNTKYEPMSGRSAGGMMSAATIRSMMGSYGAAYGEMMGGRAYGMMGGSSAPPASTSGAVSVARAHVLAQRWLDTNEPGAMVEPGGDAFPGYYTLETLRGGRIDGMISVNASTGAVWPHWWHGRFVASSA